MEATFGVASLLPTPSMGFLQQSTVQTMYTSWYDYDEEFELFGLTRCKSLNNSMLGRGEGTHVAQSEGHERVRARNAELASRARPGGLVMVPTSTNESKGSEFGKNRTSYGVMR
jgi:hypothetical protein